MPEKKIVRRTLMQVLFDVGYHASAFENAIVTFYDNLELGKVEIRVKSGFVDLEQYKGGLPWQKFYKTKFTKTKAVELAKYALETVLPTYTGPKKATDIYISSYAKDLNKVRFK